MKSLAIPLISLLAVSCAEVTASQPKSLAPRSDVFVVTGKHIIDDVLWRRLSLIMPKGSIELYNLEGTSTVDMVGLAVKGKLNVKNGYEHISRSDFKAFKAIKVNDGLYPPHDLVEYETGNKVGMLVYSHTTSRYHLTELCTGSAETLCTFSYDQNTLKFSFEFLGEDS